MAQRAARIVTSDDVLGGEPRLEGRRITVLQIADMVVRGGHDPEHVADQLNLSLAAIHRALTYYYEHPEEMAALRREHQEFAADLDERSAAPDDIRN